MASRRRDAIIGLLAAAAIVCAAAAAMPQLAMDDSGDLLLEQADPCPQVESIVKKAVEDEFRNNPQITAGFLRVFFHDCFTEGCDASILLDAEWDGGVNRGSVQPRVRALVEEIRGKVHAACGGPKVSCADILAIATRDSVVAAKGPFVPIIRGRLDRKAAADPSGLPGPFDGIDGLLKTFSDKQLKDPADLVALSGGHTVGKTKICNIVRPDFAANCSRNGNRQNLDVITPNEFDNQYFVALTRGLGVFKSDQDLASHRLTKDLVRDFANNKQRFFNQFVVSMRKLSMTKWATAQNGEIRHNCNRPNNGRVSIIDDTATGDDGFAASA